jgi:hypothetical protein
MSEEQEKGEMEEKEEGEEIQKEMERPGKVKHERLKQERIQEAQYKERQKDFRKTLTRKGKHLFDRKRKDKFLGGTKGRRGG